MPEQRDYMAEVEFDLHRDIDGHVKSAHKDEKDD